VLTDFPRWLAPDQVRVITLNDDEALSNYAKPIGAELRANMVRVDADFSATPFKAKISNAELGGARLLTSRLARMLAPPAVATWKPAR
jgi:threonyl-tRNA synthetase